MVELLGGLTFGSGVVAGLLGLDSGEIVGGCRAGQIVEPIMGIGVGIIIGVVIGKTTIGTDEIAELVAVCKILIEVLDDVPNERERPSHN